MYLKKVIVENYGPFHSLDISFNFDQSENPLPLVIIGKNGSGKTIVLSHIVNALIAAKQMIYEDCEVEQGKVYKFRSANYINSEKKFSFSNVQFSDESFVKEWQLRGTRTEIESASEFIQPRPEWQDIQPNENSHFQSSFSEESANKLYKKRCGLYFPSNRFEEPGWLNMDNLVNPVQYQDLKRVKGISNRSIIAVSSLKDCQKWLLDILLDRNTLEISINKIPLTIQSGQLVNIPTFGGYNGQASHIYEEILKLLNVLFSEPNTLRFGLGTRKNRQLSIMKNEQLWIPNLFQLSSGESLLLGLFFTIIKDYDLSGANFSTLAEIEGIVIIDEIDTHLHGKLQKEVLPGLLKLFPKIQFVITTHSPMFLLGMEITFGNKGYDIIEFPSGSTISIEGFSEFVDLFAAISATKSHVALVNEKIRESQLPIVFVEGDYDIKYLSKAIEFIHGVELLGKFRFADGEGYGNLDKIWTSMNSRVAGVLTSETLLLYDCDTKKVNSDNARVHKRVIPSNEENPIRIGIENLLASETIAKLEAENPRYIDISPARQERIRGVTRDIPELKSVNKDEKRNICDWLCQNGTIEDFRGFGIAIDQILEFLSTIENA